MDILKCLRSQRCILLDQLIPLTEHRFVPDLAAADSAWHPVPTFDWKAGLPLTEHFLVPDLAAADSSGDLALHQLLPDFAAAGSVVHLGQTIRSPHGAPFASCAVS